MNEPVKPAFTQTLSRRDFGKVVAGAAALAGLSPQMAGAFAAQESGRGGTLVFARFNDSPTLDPHHTIAGYANQVMTNIYDTLLAPNLNKDLEGVLAETWQISDDGLEYTFHLREGIAFHDGSRLDAEAVKFTFDRLLDPATAAPAAGWVSALRGAIVVDPFTVKLVLREPFSPLLGLLAQPPFGILPPGAVQALGDDFGLSPVGTGPWKFEEWVAGERIALVPNEHYHNVRSDVENQGGPLLDRLVFRTIPEAETQLAAFETGEINVFGPSPRELSRLQENPDSEVLVAGGADVWYLEFSTVAPSDGEAGVSFKPPFDDLRVRQAVGYGIDVDQIISNVLEGLAIRNYGPMPTGMWAYKPEIEEFGFHYDPEKARALLDEAGWVDADGDGVREKGDETLEVLFWTWTELANDKIAQVIQHQLGELGFNVNTELMEVGTLIARLPENVCDFDLMAKGGNLEPDVVRLMTALGWGFGRYQDEQYQSLVTRALETTDRGQRTEFYFKAAQKALADAALVPMWSSLKATAIRSNIKNYKLHPGNPDWGIFDDVYIEE